MTISRRALLLSMAGACARAAGAAKVVVVGGHPGDSECGCGGTIARLTDAGHSVTVLYA